MKRIGNILISKLFKTLLLSSVLLCLVTFNLQAQEVEVKADVSATSITLNENIRLTVSVSAPTTKIEPPQMPSMPNFNIYSAGQSSQVSWINGKSSAMMQYNYILTPRFAGKTTIEPFTVSVAGQNYLTEPIEIEVERQTPSAPRTQAQAQAQAQNRMQAAPPNIQQMSQETIRELENNGYNPNAKLPSFFMTAQTNTKKAYINEQVNLKIRFYNSQNVLGQPIYTPPQLRDLSSQDIAQRDGFEQFGNRRYHYTEIETALFGLVSGVAEIGSAAVTYTSSEGFFDAFDVFFRGANGGETRKVESDLLFVDILPLPTDKPQSFYGAVGTNYTISSKLDLKEVPAGEPITLSVTVKGVGNLAAIKDIPVPDLGSSFRIYETSADLKNKISHGKVTGTKVYKTVIVPRASGHFTIPEIEFSYFDTESKTYKTIKAGALELNVLPSTTEGSKTLSFAAENGTETSPQIQHLTKDISYLKHIPQNNFDKFIIAINKFGNNNFYAFALILFNILVILMRKGEFSLTAGIKPYLKAKKALKRAENLDSFPEILKNYIEGKMNAQIGLMNIEDVSKKLKLTPALNKELLDSWNRFSMFKYAPVASAKLEENLKEEKRRALALISALEKEIK